MLKNIKTEEEYNRILAILQEEKLSDLDKFKTYRLNLKAGGFMIIDGSLYLKSSDGMHKKVMIQNHIESMKLEVSKIHDDNHYGQNRLYNHCKALFPYLEHLSEK
ncbi:hypothetical protein NGRA_3524 [Nosema granulosis]|uniref:Uncharacterized protein n=1 Tax=Nosema granulosis TaxID=83296 RepID=A0A9P6GUK1_9MICR|nr:hypothetical protein NGRA_3524 [Nosema granulosis]